MQTRREKGARDMDVFDCGVVLFESGERGEGLRVGCAITPEGALEIVQESDGPLAKWCFEETPHCIGVVVGPADVSRLLEYFRLDNVQQLPPVLRLEFTGYGCFDRLRTLMKGLTISCEVHEEFVAC